MRRFHIVCRSPGEAASGSPRSRHGDDKDLSGKETVAESFADTQKKGVVARETTPHSQKTTEPQKAAPAQEGQESKKKKKSSTVGDFKLLKKLGQGGMGEVYLAHQISLDRKVAFKTLTKQLASKKSFIERFYREARSMAKIDHPHVVRGFAVGEAGGIHYVAMEFIDGSSLHDWMKKLARLSIADSLHIALRCAEALEHAHELQIIHRDIKPDNVLITKSGIVKVADLGLAKALDDDMSMTQSGTGLGTPYYMPPEQARNAKYVDGRSDIYALGGMLYYCVTGAHAFEGDSTLEIIQAKERGIFKSARRLNPEVPERLDLIIDKALAKEPSHRYRNCTELIADLESLQMDAEFLSFIEGGDVSPAAKRTARQSSRTRTPSPPAQKTTSPQRPVTTPRGEKKKRRRAPSSQPSSSDRQTVATGHWWYVQYRNSSNKKVVSKLRTAQVQQQVKAGNISTRAKVKSDPEADYAPLASFPEFQDIVQRKLVEKRATKQQEQFNALYDRIDREERWYQRMKWLRRFTDTVQASAGFLVYLIVIGLVIAGAVLYYRQAINWVATMLGFEAGLDE